MSDKLPEEVLQQDQNQIRQNLVTTAVHFLLNPSVIDKPNEQKSAFLRKKGLTEAEITLAYERANIEAKSKQIQGNYVASSPAALPPPVALYKTPVSFWTRLSRFSSSVIILGVALFGAHYVYKKYIEPLIFGEVHDAKSQRLEKQLQEMINSLVQLQTKISELEENVKGQKDQIDKIVQNEVNEYYPTPVALRELKTEIASVKSLMLNRHQFPALPKVTSPSIPEWQLPSKENGTESNPAKENGESSQSQHVDEKISPTKPSTDISSDDSDSIELINGVGKSENSKDETVKNDSAEVLNDSLPVS